MSTDSNLPKIPGTLSVDSSMQLNVKSIRGRTKSMMTTTETGRESQGTTQTRSNVPKVSNKLQIHKEAFLRGLASI